MPLLRAKNSNPSSTWYIKLEIDLAPETLPAMTKVFFNNLFRYSEFPGGVKTACLGNPPDSRAAEKKQMLPDLPGNMCFEIYDIRGMNNRCRNLLK
jgi:hypothetical protein